MAVRRGDLSGRLPPDVGVPVFTSSSRPVVGVQLSGPGGNVVYRLPPQTGRNQLTRGSPFWVAGLPSAGFSTSGAVGNGSFAVGSSTFHQRPRSMTRLGMFLRDRLNAAMDPP